MTIEEFKQKYGMKTVSLTVEAFVERAPSFPGDIDLANLLGEMMADLESALKETK